MKKEVYTIRGKDVKVEMKECIPRALPFSSRYIAPYWYAAIRNVFEYDKIRGLQTIHKLTSDDRIWAGYQLYKNGHIKEAVVTKYAGGDVRAIVLSEDGKNEYTVIIKNYLPDKPPQYNFEREEFIANLLVSCTCPDATISKYKDNSSMIDKHVAAILWFLIDKFDMPRIFILPEEKMIGYQKSKPEELEVNINVMPLIKFRQFINILLLKEFKNIKTSMSLSVHRISNETDTEMSRPIWLTLSELDEAKKLLRGIYKGYVGMAKSRGQSDEEIYKTISEFIDILPREQIIQKKHWWKTWFFGR